MYLMSGRMAPMGEVLYAFFDFFDFGVFLVGDSRNKAASVIRLIYPLVEKVC